MIFFEKAMVLLNLKSFFYQIYTHFVNNRVSNIFVPSGNKERRERNE